MVSLVKVFATLVLVFLAGCGKDLDVDCKAAETVSTSLKQTVVVGPSVRPLKVYSDLQPANSVALPGQIVPFTTVTFVAPGEDTVIDSVLVERTGYSLNTPFLGVVMLDQNGKQIGKSEPLNPITSQALLRGPFLVPGGGKPAMFFVAGVMANDLAQFGGQVAALNVVDVYPANTVVVGELPLKGAAHTISGCCYHPKTQLKYVP